MNLSLAWLRDFVATRTPAAALGEKFRMTSSELEGISDWNERFAGLVVGHVTAVSKHPNADRLRIAEVDADMKRIIVCGAPNLAEGQAVIVATPGTVLQPAGKESFTIAEAEIRGVKSAGMLCGLEEIGIPIPSDGIFVFSEAVVPGTPVSEALFENDTVLDLEITPNRSDLLSHIGLAREVSAFEQRKLTLPPVATFPKGPFPKSITVTMDGHKECSRFTGIALELSIGESPTWMQMRLLRTGIRPINAVVDVTNYVMLELGQPMHAYDLDKLPLNKEGSHYLNVRPAKKGEKIAILDGTTRDLTTDDIIIEDANGAVIDLAGIMGGHDSSISDSTTHVYLESASFSASHVRRTSRRLGLRSEASLRFEKGIDPELNSFALKRAVYLLQEIAGAKIISKMTDEHCHAPLRPHIHVTFEDINRILGVRISAADCKEILLHLGFELKEFTKSGFTATPPSWRRDVTMLEDVIEELIRIWGYEHLPYTLPLGAVKPPRKNTSVARKNTLHHLLAAEGFHETLHLTLTSEQALQRTGIDAKTALPVKSPLSAEGAYLSPSHLVGMLADCGSVNGAEAELRLFEIGKIFLPPHEEHEHLTLLHRSDKVAEEGVRHIKTTLNRIAQVLNLAEITYQKGENLPYGEKGMTLDIFSDKTMIGKLTLVSDSVVAAHKIRRGRNLVAAEMNVDILLALPQESHFFELAPVFPVSERDLTVTIPATTSLETVLTIARDTVNSDIVRDWYIADIFTGKPLPEDRKAITLHLIYNSPERTLSDDEMKQHHDKLEQALQSLTQS